MAMAEFNETTESFLWPLLWNFVLYDFSHFKMSFCNYAGMWGLFWYNDNGEMMDKCFEIGLVGVRAEYVEASTK